VTARTASCVWVCMNMSWLVVKQKSKSFSVHGLQCTRTCAMKKQHSESCSLMIERWSTALGTFRQVLCAALLRGHHSLWSPVHTSCRAVICSHRRHCTLNELNCTDDAQRRPPVPAIHMSLAPSSDHSFLIETHVYSQISVSMCLLLLRALSG